MDRNNRIPHRSQKKKQQKNKNFLVYWVFLSNFEDSWQRAINIHTSCVSTFFAFEDPLTTHCSGAYVPFDYMLPGIKMQMVPLILRVKKKKEAFLGAELSKHILYSVEARALSSLCKAQPRWHFPNTWWHSYVTYVIATVFIINIITVCLRVLCTEDHAGILKRHHTNTHTA